MIDFAYSGLNLRFNPFGELERQQKIENAIARCDFEQVLTALGSFHQEQQPDRSPNQSPDNEVDRQAIQFIGNPGSGKSTHLLMLANRFPEFHYIHIPMNCRRAVPQADHLMVDEAQRLTRRQRIDLFARARRVILGTHRCFQKQLEANGFSVTTVSLDIAPPREWLKEALQKKIESARRSNDLPPLVISDGTVLKLIGEFGNNIRAMERRLYETVHELKSNPHPIDSI